MREGRCGIREGDLAGVFEPLSTTKARGIGLGLAILGGPGGGEGRRDRGAGSRGRGRTLTPTVCGRRRLRPKHVCSIAALVDITQVEDKEEHYAGCVRWR